MCIKSTNGGMTWIPVNTGLTASYVCSLVIDPVTSNNSLCGHIGYGVFKSIGRWRELE